jgi:hypothetical protein
VSTRSLEHSGFGIDDAHQVVPGFDERFGAFFLKLVRQYMDVNAFPSELCQFVFGVHAVRGQVVADIGVIGCANPRRVSLPDKGMGMGVTTL